jgi:hypothetical protein
MDTWLIEPLNYMEFWNGGYDEGDLPTINKKLRVMGDWISDLSSLFSFFEIL